LRALVSRSQRHGLALSVVLLDVDGIGDVNAEHGHAARDTVLETVAARVRSQLREEDAAGRWSGDELLVVAPDTAAGGVGSVGAAPRGPADAEPARLRAQGA